MTGAEDVERSFGSSENLRARPQDVGSGSKKKIKRDALFTKQVAKPDDGICTIFH
jgi:hypothetical protein